MTWMQVLQIIVIPLLGLVWRSQELTRSELVRVRERLAAVETAVEIGLGVEVPKRSGRK